MTIVERLRAGERLVLDGGTGSELQRRGVDVLQQVTKRLKAWTAMANLGHADVVQQVHQDYLRVGADIITSNNFWTSPTRMATVGMQDRWREYAAAAVESRCGRATRPPASGPQRPRTWPVASRRRRCRTPLPVT